MGDFILSENDMRKILNVRRRVPERYFSGGISSTDLNFKIPRSAACTLSVNNTNIEEERHKHKTYKT